MGAGQPRIGCGERFGGAGGCADHETGHAPAQAAACAPAAPKPAACAGAPALDWAASASMAAALADAHEACSLLNALPPSLADGHGAAASGAREAHAEPGEAAAAAMAWSLRFGVCYAKAVASGSFDAVLLDTDLPARAASGEEAGGGGASHRIAAQSAAGDAQQQQQQQRSGPPTGGGSGAAPERQPGFGCEYARAATGGAAPWADTGGLAIGAVLPASLLARLHVWCGLLTPRTQGLARGGTAARALSTSALVAMARCALAQPALAALAAHARAQSNAPAAAPVASCSSADGRAMALRRVWAALTAAGEEGDFGGRSDHEDGGWPAQPLVDVADGQFAPPRAERSAELAAAAEHVTERTVFVDSWVGGPELLVGLRGLRTLGAALRRALGAGWALRGLAIESTAHEHVLTCTAEAIGTPGSVALRATFQFEPSVGASPERNTVQTAAISMAVIAWDVLALGSNANVGWRQPAPHALSPAAAANSMPPSSGAHPRMRAATSDPESSATLRKFKSTS